MKKIVLVNWNKVKKKNHEKLTLKKILKLTEFFFLRKMTKSAFKNNTKTTLHRLDHLKVVSFKSWFHSGILKSGSNPNQTHMSMLIKSFQDH